MRWAHLPVIALVAAGAIASAAPVSARALRTNRTLDARIEVCGAKCAPVAIGDFNGDGVDDAVFQENRGDERHLNVVLGPFGGAAEVATDIQVTGGRTLVAADVADMNGDGQAELIVAGVSSHMRALAVSVIDFDLLVDGNGALPRNFFVGLDRAPYVWTHTLDRPNAGIDPPRLAVRAADMDGDGGLDLVLGIDPPAAAATNSRTRNAAAPDGTAAEASQVVVQRVPRDFFSLKPPGGEGVSTISWPLKRLAPAAGSTVAITGLGACAGGSGLAGVADVTGDGANDIVVRRCEGGALPDQLGLVAGRAAWPASLEIDGAIRPMTPPVPPGPGRPSTPPEPPGGGGYIQSDPRGPGRNLFDGLPLFVIADLNADGVRDVGFGMADKTHIWLGGPDIGSRLIEGRSDRIMLGAGVGGAMTNRSWRPSDLDGDGDGDLALTRLNASAGRNVEARDASGALLFDPAPFEPIHIFARDRSADDVIDVTSDVPDELMNDPRYTLWAFGDFNGDGHDDVMLGSPAASADSVYPVVYGPFVRR